MSYLQEAIDIESLFATEWAAGPNTPIAYDNSDYDETSGVPYVRLLIQSSSARQIELGKSTNNYRHDGTIVVQVICASDDNGTAIARGLADDVADIFRSRFIGTGIVCKTPDFDRVGQYGDYYQINVNTEFHRDTIF